MKRKQLKIEKPKSIWPLGVPSTNEDHLYEGPGYKKGLQAFLSVRQKNGNNEWNKIGLLIEKLELQILTLKDRVNFLTKSAAKVNEEICQTLGGALDYPWFQDDQKNFPGTTEEQGVCVGDNVAETLAIQAARKIQELKSDSKKI